MTAESSQSRSRDMRALADAATEGPWHRHTYGHRDSRSQVRAVGKALRERTEATAGLLMTDLTWVHQDPEGPSVCLAGNGPKQTDNAAFIAASRDAVPLLLDVLDAARNHAYWGMPRTYGALQAALAAYERWEAGDG